MLRAWFNLCLFASKPQDFPASGGHLAAGALASFGGYWAGNMLLSQAPGAIAVAAAQTLLLGGGLWLLLRLFRKPERWLQAAAAVYGASAATHLAMLPVMVWFSGGQAVERYSAAMWGVAAFRLWFFAVLVHIVKEALEIRVAAALAVTLAMQLLSAFVLISLFGA